nr:MAG TPA: hypothetical protein [Caudoviricetes sp.]
MLYHAVPNHPQIEKLILYNLSGIEDSPPCGYRDVFILYHKAVHLSNCKFEIWTFQNPKGHSTGEKDTLELTNPLFTASSDPRWLNSELRTS